MRIKFKLIILALCLTFMGAFVPIEADASSPCPKVWVEGHYDHHDRWVKAHWKQKKRVKGHYNRYGKWVPGHCR